MTAHEHNHCDRPRCTKPWEVNYLGKRLCMRHWLELCADPVTPPPVRAPKAAPYVARAPSPSSDQYIIADWLAVELPGVE